MAHGGSAGALPKERRMAKRSNGRVERMVKKVALPVAAKLAQGAAKALEAADRALDERLAKTRARKAAATGAPKQTQDRTAARAPTPRVVRKAQPQPAGKRSRAPGAGAGGSTRKKAKGPVVKRGQKHSHHR
jgi:hypothetical protein